MVIYDEKVLLKHTGTCSSAGNAVLSCWIFWKQGSKGKIEFMLMVFKLKA